LGGYFLWAVFLKISEVRQIIGLLFSMVEVMCQFLTKKGWATFGRFFHELLWSLWFVSTMLFEVAKVKQLATAMKTMS
jgi:hypothetical protein